MLHFLDYENFRKARKSLLLASGFTLIFATMTIVSDRLSLFGFELAVSKSRIVALGQVTVMILLIIFALRMMPECISAFERIALRRIDQQHRAKSRDLSDSWGLNDQNQYQNSPEGEFEELRDTFNYKKDRVSQSLKTLIDTINRVASATIDFALPASIGIIAIFDPYILDRNLDLLDKTDTSDADRTLLIVPSRDDLTDFGLWHEENFNPDVSNSRQHKSAND